MIELMIEWSMTRFSDVLDHNTNRSYLLLFLWVSWMCLVALSGLFFYAFWSQLFVGRESHCNWSLHWRSRSLTLRWESQPQSYRARLRFSHPTGNAARVQHAFLYDSFLFFLVTGYCLLIGLDFHFANVRKQFVRVIVFFSPIIQSRCLFVISSTLTYSRETGQKSFLSKS